MELERQDLLEVARQIAQNKTGYPGPWSPAEVVSLDIDQLGVPTIGPLLDALSSTLCLRHQSLGIILPCLRQEPGRRFFAGILVY
jgi:hypothetical protein